MIATRCRRPRRPLAAPRRRLAAAGYPARLALAVALLASLGSAAASRVHATAATDAPLAPQRVLLIGNSYTRFNVMPRLLARLSEEVPGARRLAVDAEA